MTPVVTVFVAAIVALAGLMPAGIARADCPDGGRLLSDSERQAYLAMQQAIKAAIPPAPPGWALKDPTAKSAVAAPKEVCTGDAAPGWYGTYFSEEQSKQNMARSREHQARVREASKYTAEEQKELDEILRQGRELEQKARAVVRTNPDEAARIRADAKPLNEKAQAIRIAHRERVAPALEALMQEYASEFVDPMVRVDIIVSDQKKQREAKEPLQVPGAASAFLTNPKKIVLSLGEVAPAKASGGIGTEPRTLWVEVSGDRPVAEPIAKLLASSSLGTVAKR